MPQYVFLNGGLVEAAEAQISVWDGGWLHGAGLFETMRAAHGRIFRLDAHLERLMASAGQLLIPLERPDLPLTADLAKLLEINGLREARVRLTVTAGPMIETRVDPQRPPGDRPKLTVCASAVEAAAYPQEFYDRGMTVAISPFKVSPSDPIARHKSTAYLPRLLALRDAHRKQCSEALWFTTDHLLAEGSISNVFLVRQGALLTPSLELPILPGITRAVVVELAQAADLEVKETRLTVNDLLDADEVLITNSMMGVMPVCRIERQHIGQDQPGPITKRLREEYQALVEKECRSDGETQFGGQHG